MPVDIINTRLKYKRCAEKYYDLFGFCCHSVANMESVNRNESHWERVDPANDWFCCCCCVLICVTWEPPLFSPVRSIQIQLIFFAQQQNVATLFVDAIEKNREWNYWAANNICVCYIFWLWNANDRVSNWNNSYSQHNTKCISWSMKSQS